MYDYTPGCRKQILGGKALCSGIESHAPNHVLHMHGYACYYIITVTPPTCDNREDGDCERDRECMLAL